MEVKIEKLSPGNIDEFIELIRVFEDVFEMKNFLMPGLQHLKQLLKRRDFFVFIALIKKKLLEV